MTANLCIPVCPHLSLGARVVAALLAHIHHSGAIVHQAQDVRGHKPTG